MPTKLDNFSTAFQKAKSLLFPIILLSLLASCSTKQAPIKTIASKVATDIEEIVTDSAAMTAEQRVELAQSLPSEAAVDELIIASKLFFQQKNYPKALWLADKTLPLIDEKVAKHKQQNIQLVLIKATSLQELGYFEESHIQLEQLESFSSKNQIALTATYYRLLSAAFQEQKRPIAALNAKLHAFSMTGPNAQSKQEIELIWQQFEGLSQWQLNLLALDTPPKSEGWLQLTRLANKFIANPEQFQYQLSIWQQKFKSHPANLIAAQLLAQNLNVKVINNVAVILPLTGKQRSAGQAIQQGILASFDNDTNKKLHFLDSNTLNWYDLNNQLSTYNVDYVIGPLLKSNVDKYIRHTSTQAQNDSEHMLNASKDVFDFNTTEKLSSSSDSSKETSLASISAIDSDAAIKRYLSSEQDLKSVSTLLLNIPADALLSNHHTVLSMRPEDEASQAAATLSRKNFEHPIVLSQKNIVSKRIAQAFVKQWHRITGDTVEVVYYDAGNQMQANIKTSLAVDKSAARIAKLKGRLNQSIKTQTRNRRDIDMIYLVGSPQKTRLVKPHIAVNTSPFSKTIPVFASSRSHSTKSDYSSNSDLRGLTFTEIPWLLPSEQNIDLASLSQQLWPKRTDGLSRLFAMGYDSYQLISKIPLMQQAPSLQHWGQTGVLKLDENKILTRSLLWGSYKRNKVVSIAME